MSNSVSAIPLFDKGIRHNHSAKKGPLFMVWIALVLIAVVGLSIFYQLQSKSADQKTHSLLQSVAESKVAYLDGWLNERYADLATFTESQGFIDFYPLLSRDAKQLERVENRIKIFNELYGYEKLTLLDANDQIISTIGNENISVGEHTSQLVQNAKRQLTVQTQLFIQDDVFHLDFVAPIVNRQAAEPEYLGSMVLHINPAEFIIPMLNRWPVKTETGQTELVFAKFNTLKGEHSKTLRLLALENARFILNEVPTQDGGALVELNHAKPHANQAKLFKLSTANGQKVFQYHTHLEQADWVLITSISKTEAYRNLYSNLVILALGLVVTLSLIGLLFLRILRSEKNLVQSELLEQSQSYFMGLFMDAPIAYQSLNERGEVFNVNRAWCDLFGYTQEEAIGQPYERFVGADSVATFRENFPKLFESGYVNGVECTIKTREGHLKLVRIEGRISTHSVANQTYSHCVLVDITKQKQEARLQQRTLAVTKALFDLSVDAPALDESGLLEMAMNSVERFTNSQIGFVHFVSEDQNQIQLGTWSSNTLKHYCTANFDNHYPVEKAGIWADSIRSKQAKVVNDYASEPNKKGLPEGHSHLERFVSVPIISDGLVRMIVGVGNAPEAYDAFDVSSITQFGNELYQLVLIKRTQQKLEESEKRFYNLFAKAPLPYQSLSEEGNILEVNEAWLSLFGFHHADLDLIIGKPMRNFVTSESASRLETQFRVFLESGHVEEALFDVQTQTGELKQVQVTGRISVASDNSLRTHCILVDVTEQRRTEQQLRLSDKVFSNTGEGVMVTDSNCQIISVNQAFSNILGYEADEVIGKTPHFLRSGQHDEDFYDVMWHEIKQHGLWQGEIWNRHKDGALVPEWLTITALTNKEREVENYIGVFADISKLKASQAELDYLAHHDVLTKLPNRRKFLSNLEYALSHVKRSQQPFALLTLDLDRFKDVNDSYGHAAGDEVLLHVAQILKENIREGDMVARLGGDEFAILIEDLQQVTDAAQVAKAIISNISAPQKLQDNRVVSVGCSIGIALYPEHGTDSEVLVQHADSALFLAKKSKGTFEYFTADMTESAMQRMQIEADLKLALTNNELRVFLQPQVNLENNQVKGAEALVRWQHPVKGLLSPFHFIGIAEDSGLIAQIGRWVMYETCRQAKVWYDQGVTDFVYAVNVSPKQLAYTNLLEVVMDVLQETGLPAECLELEITESGLIESGKEAVGLFESLRGLGVRIAIDDFGTGYSSLSYLKTLPIDILKIDKSFVDDIPHNEQGMQIVNTIIAMGHNLGLKVLAEGVESDVQKRFLQLRGCNYYQGYVMSRPVPFKEFHANFIEKKAVN